MLIISVRYNQNNRWKRNANKQTKKKKTKTEKNERNKIYSERVRAKWFWCAFKLGFLELICKVFLLFKSELALSIILKEKELYELKHVFRNMRLVILFDMFLSYRFKMTASFADIARTTASTSKFIY